MKKSSILLIAALALPGASQAAIPDGYVVRADSISVYLDWGAGSGVQPRDRFQIFREGAALKHPVSGELLGHTETAVATGTVDRVESKFSTGHLLQPGTPRVGDRIRWLRSETAAAAPATAAADEGDVLPGAPTIKEIWRSEPLDKEPVGITFADLDGDGQKDVIIAYRKGIQAYHLKDKRLEAFAAFDEHSYRHWLAVDTADLRHDGHEEIFATTFIDGINRPRIMVLRYENGALKRVGELEGFARAIAHADGSRPLYWQGMSRAREVNFTPVADLVFDKGSYRAGSTQNLKLFDDQLFGFAWGDWDKDAKEDLAILEHGERIRVRLKDLKWKSRELYGGTKNDFYIDENNPGSLYPRLVLWRPPQGDRDQLLVPTNHPELGIRLTHMKLYRRSRIDSLLWNGLDMKSAARASIDGYLADFGLADLLGQARPQIWALVEGPGSKTVLVGYNLPQP